MARILVVDDNQDIAAALVALARAAGCEASAVYDGESAIVAMGAGDIDLVVLDCHMPDITGLDVMRRAKGKTHSPAPPIIMVSADELVREDAMKLGAHAFISKGSASFNEIVAIFQKYGGCSPDA